MILTTFMEQISKSRYVEWVEQEELFFAWNGVRTVNVFNKRGDNIDCFTLMTEVSDHMEILEHIQEYVDGLEREREEEEDDNA